MPSTAITADTADTVITADTADTSSMPDGSAVVESILSALTDMSSLVHRLDEDPVPEHVLMTVLRRTGETSRRRVATHPAATPAVLAVAMTDRKASVRTGAAGNPNTPTDVLDRAVRDRSKYVREAVAQHPSTSRDVRDRLARDPQTEVSLSAVRGDISPSVRQWATRAKNVWVRIVVARRDDLTRSEALRLATDRDPDVRLAIAASTVYDDVLFLLADDIVAVAVAVARNPASTPDVLHRCAGHADPSVRRATGRRTETAHATDVLLAADPHVTVRTEVGFSTSFPDIVEILSADPAADVRSAVARNSSCPHGLRVSMLPDRAQSVEDEVLIRCSGDPSVVEAAMTSRFPAVRRTARGFATGLAPVRPTGPDDRSAAALWWADECDDDAELLASIDSGLHTSVLSALVMRDHLSAEVLEKLAHAPDWRIRRSVARHTDCPPHLIDTLLTDRRASVRAAAVRAHVPESMERALATDPSAIVRRAMASSFSTRPGLLRRLSRDSDAQVRAAAKLSLATWEWRQRNNRLGHRPGR